MYSKLTFLFLLCLPLASAFAQSCTPDPFYADSIGIFPKPEQAEVPGSGIPVKACIGQPYKMDFTVRVPSTIIYSGFPIEISAAYLPPNAVSGLPAGISYECNTPNCEYPVNVLNCVSLLGTPDASNAPGEYPLVIKVKVVTAFGTIDLDFPNASLAPGEYILRVEAADSPYCQGLDAKDLHGAIQGVSLFPNPATDQLRLKYTLAESGPVFFSFYELDGRVSLQYERSGLSGENAEDLNTTSLSPGNKVIQIRTAQGIYRSLVTITD